MPAFISTVLVIHVLSGITCFVAGLVAIATKKGSKRHRLAGRIYFSAMFIVLLSAVIIATFKANRFLLYIACFAFYLTWAGIRSIYNKSLHPNAFDLIFWLLGAIVSGIMISSLHPILLGLGSLFALNIVQEAILFINNWRGKPLQPKQWLIRHVSMMLGSYIATVTAALVVNVQSINPQWLPWLAPSLIGTPIIIYYLKKIKEKKPVEHRNKLT